MEIFIQHIMVRKYKSMLLLMDNYQSHLSLSLLDLPNVNWAVILSLPPHTTSKFKFLYGPTQEPFKKLVNSASGAWLRSNTEKR
jgi:hypothetical protein